MGFDADSARQSRRKDLKKLRTTVNNSQVGHLSWSDLLYANVQMRRKAANSLIFESTFHVVNDIPSGDYVSE